MTRWLDAERVRALESIRMENGECPRYSREPELWCERAAASLRLFGVDQVPSGEALDIGCGYGYFLHVLRTWGWDALGLNSDRPAIRAALDILRVPWVAHQIAPAVLLPEGLGMFDLILMLHVNFWATQQDARTQAQRLCLCALSHLRGGGRLVVRPNRGPTTSGIWCDRETWRAVCPEDVVYTVHPNDAASSAWIEFRKD